MSDTPITALAPFEYSKGYDPGITRLEAIDGYRAAIAAASEDGNENELLRELMQKDLFFLLIFGLGGNTYANNDWVFERCREFQANSNGYIDLWPRFHYKSTIITLAAAIQRIINDPEITIGIFSYNRPTAKVFLRAIKTQFESNEKLKELFPDILWTDPVKEAPKWSLDSNTPILTTRGWKRHGDLEPGDRIFGSNGRVITVTGNSGPMYNVPCFKVTFDDGELVASSEHLWPVEVKSSSGAPWSRASMKTLQTSELHYRDKTQRMPATPSLGLIGEEEHDLPVDPYILGLWLGNGTAGTNIISFHNDDVVSGLKNIEAAGYSHYIHRSKASDNFSMIAVSGLKEKLDTAGCLRNKFVPERYLYNSPEVRKSILQGLMDSDGTCRKDGKNRCLGMAMFSNTNEALANAVMFLATSFGMRPSMVSFMPKSRGRLRVYQVYFVGIRSKTPFRLERKLGNCKEARTRCHRYVKSIEPVKSRTVNCIKVDAPDSLYLAGERLIVTHNSEDDGIVVKRKTFPKEMTVEASGLVDSMPTGRHYRLRIYDDVVVPASVSSPEMIDKTTEAIELSFNLGTIDGEDEQWMVGTVYNRSDTNQRLIARGAVKPRVYAATKDGTLDGEPWVMSPELLRKKIKDMGSYVASCQLFNKPVLEGEETFNPEWVQYWRPDKLHKLNLYMLIDPANSKTKKSDYTVILIMGLGPDRNYYLVDGIRDKLSIRERTSRVMAMHAQYRPLNVGYEKYGIQTDIEFLEEMQAKEQYRFRVTPLGGSMSKEDRIRRLQPLFESRRVYLPEKLIRVDYQGKQYDFTQVFLQNEYLQFPYMVHDDMLDCMARITDEDLKVSFPSGLSAGPTGRIEEDEDAAYDFDTYSY